MNDKPKVSFCIISYNQERYIKEAIESAFAQEYENLEIIISDDASSDSTPFIIKEMVENYKGSHEVIYNLNEKNLGIREHCNKVLYNLAKGDIILLAGGDDVSMPDRTAKYVDIFTKFPEVMSVSCKSMETDENMRPLNEAEEYDCTYTVLNVHDYTSFADFVLFPGDSRGIRREVIDSFPKLEYPRAEDIYLFIRSLLLGSVCYLREPLVKRRNHNSNFSKVRNKHYHEFEKQTNADIDFAYQRGYISTSTVKEMKDKVYYLRRIFEIYWNPPASSFTTLLYRILGKVFNVKIKMARRKECK